MFTFLLVFALCVRVVEAKCAEETAGVVIIVAAATAAFQRGSIFATLSAEGHIDMVSLVRCLKG